MDLKPMATTPAPAPDPFEGVGGSYRIDPATGRRVQVVAPPDTAPAPTASAAAPVQMFVSPRRVVPADDAL